MDVTGGQQGQLRILPSGYYNQENCLSNKGGMSDIYRISAGLVDKVPKDTRAVRLSEVVETEWFRTALQIKDGPSHIPFSYYPSRNAGNFIIFGKEYPVRDLELKLFLSALYEGQVLADLQGTPYVVESPGYAICLNSDGELFCSISLRHLPGKTLNALGENGNLSLFRTARAIAHTGKALAAIKSRGFVHRDVKPSNIMYDPNAEATTVIDFGVAKCINGYASTENPAIPELYKLLLGSFDKDEAGFIRGTPLYLSPEQVRGDDSYVGIDEFALGLTAFNLLTGGRHAFQNQGIDLFIDKANYSNNTTRSSIIDRLRAQGRDYQREQLPDDLVDAIKILLDESTENRIFAPVVEAAGNVAAQEKTLSLPHLRLAETAEVPTELNLVNRVGHITSDRTEPTQRRGLITDLLSPIVRRRD